MEYLRCDTTTGMGGSQEPGILKKLHEMNDKLEEIQKVVETQGGAFPRLSFLSRMTFWR
jgi:hypothetical protein